MIKKLFFKAETGPLAFLIAGALTCSGIHLTKLALDPHTQYSKSVDDRKWEGKKTYVYSKIKWEDVMDNNNRKN